MWRAEIDVVCEVTPFTIGIPVLELLDIVFYQYGGLLIIYDNQIVDHV